jgi:hypothetical protein
MKIRTDNKRNLTMINAFIDQFEQRRRHLSALLFDAARRAPTIFDLSSPRGSERIKNSEASLYAMLLVQWTW